MRASALITDARPTTCRDRILWVLWVLLTAMSAAISSSGCFLAFWVSGQVTVMNGADRLSVGSLGFGSERTHEYISKGGSLWLRQHAVTSHLGLFRRCGYLVYTQPEGESDVTWKPGCGYYPSFGEIPHSTWQAGVVILVLAAAVLLFLTFFLLCAGISLELLYCFRIRRACSCAHLAGGCRVQLTCPSWQTDQRQHSKYAGVILRVGRYGNAGTVMQTQTHLTQVSEIFRGDHLTEDNEVTYAFSGTSNHYLSALVASLLEVDACTDYHDQTETLLAMKHAWRQANLTCACLLSLGVLCLTTCFLFPFGWANNSEIQQICGPGSGAFRIGSCEVGWAFVLTVSGGVISITLSAMPTLFYTTLVSRSQQRYFQQNNGLLLPQAPMIKPNGWPTNTSLRGHHRKQPYEDRSSAFPLLSIPMESSAYCSASTGPSPTQFSHVLPPSATVDANSLYCMPRQTVRRSSQLFTNGCTRSLMLPPDFIFPPNQQRMSVTGSMFGIPEGQADGMQTFRGPDPSHLENEEKYSH